MYQTCIKKQPRPRVAVGVCIGEESCGHWPPYGSGARDAYGTRHRFSFQAETGTDSLKDPAAAAQNETGYARIFGYQILGTLSEMIDQVELSFESGTDAAAERGVRTATLSHSIEQAETPAHAFGDPRVILIVHGGMFHYPSQHSRKTVRQKQVRREVNPSRVAFSRKDSLMCSK